MGIIGAILGDISGSQYEFMRNQNPNWKTCELFTDNCNFTDDSVMTLATKLAIKENIPFDKAYRELGNKYPNAGYAGMFYTWLHCPNQKDYNSFGNGSAMRCSFIAEHFNTEKEVINWATKSSICTHSHFQGVKGAIVTSMCAFMAKQGASKQEIYKYASKHYPKEDYKYSVEYSISEYRDNYKWDVTCQGSVPVAIRCFLESENYESFLRNVHSIPCDMDTICAIGGGIAEEFYKSTGLDEEYWLKKYLDKYLYDLVQM